jgi:hypothetical protein
MWHKFFMAAVGINTNYSMKTELFIPAILDHTFSFDSHRNKWQTNEHIMPCSD